MPLYSAFIDLTKMFNTINRKALWTVLEQIGWPWKFVNIIQLFYDGIAGQVFTGRDVTEPFAISNSVKQGCVLAPVLLNIFTCMMVHAAQDLESGVYIQYRLNDSLFDLRHLTAKTESLFDLIQRPCLLMTVLL